MSLAAIEVSALNTRKNLEAGTEDAGLDELAQSIRANGLIQPPTLRERRDGIYEVIAGQRRVLACQLLGWPELEAFVANCSDDEALAASLVENLQRADMHPIDKARGLEQLVKRAGSESKAAAVSGLSATTVSKYLSLLRLPEDLRGLLGTAEGPTGVGAMAALARSFEDPDRARTAYDLVSGFKSGIAERLLRQARGDLDALENLRDRAVDGEFDVERCGSSLAACPWLMELPHATQDALLAILEIGH